MSRYQTYPSYKDSGVEWLGEVPEHWEIGLLSSLFSDNKEKNAGLKNSNLLSLSYGNIIQKDIDTLTGLLPESFDSYQIVHPGYIVLRLTDLQNDKKSLRTGFVQETGIITSAYVGLAKKSQSIGNEKYFHLYLHTFDAHKGFYGMGAGVRQGLNFDELKKLKFTLPPYEEQNRIVEFIEKETTKIDTLIAKQQRMIELLGEKRSAMISHAVTKGLNPDVAMKDSGIEWLGEVPERWGKATINKLIDVRDGTHETPIYVDKDENSFPLVTSKDFENDRIVFTKTKYISRFDHVAITQRSKVENGDVLMSMIGGNIGKCLIVDIEEEISIKNVALFKTNRTANFAKLLKYYLNSKLLEIQVDLVNRGGAQPFLSLGDVRSLVFPIIPSDEQREIVNYLDDKTFKIDTLIAKAQQAIELMKERRTALISAAVTGKIDVRGM